MIYGVQEARCLQGLATAKKPQEKLRDAAEAGMSCVGECMCVSSAAVSAQEKTGAVDAREEKAGLGRVFRLLFQGGEGGDLSCFERIGGQALRGEPSPDHSLGRFGGEGLC